jgi:hypothetical protein
MAKKLLNECIIVSKKFGNDMVLAKNRDRAYKPEIEIVHTFINGVEVVYLHDITTDWSEGMNEYGIGLVNASLMVGFDEKEKDIIGKTGKKSEDGLRIRYALGQKSLKEAIKSVVKYDGGVKGHTFLADPNHLITIEMTSKHKPVIKQQNPADLYVRTNHGLSHPDAGYTEGPDYKSSVIRRASAKAAIGTLKDWRDELKALRKNRFSHNNPNNMSRDAEKMKTTSQMQLNLTQKIFTLNYFGDRVSGFKGVRDELPSDYIPKIKIRIKDLAETPDN